MGSVLSPGPSGTHLRLCAVQVCAGQVWARQVSPTLLATPRRYRGCFEMRVDHEIMGKRSRKISTLHYPTWRGFLLSALAAVRLPFKGEH